MSKDARDWVDSLDNINRSVRGALSWFAGQFNPKWEWGYIPYADVQRKLNLKSIRAVNYALKELRQKGLMEAHRHPDPKRSHLLQYRLLMPQVLERKRVSALQKSFFPGSQDQQDDIRGMTPVTLTTDWPDDEPIPPLTQEKINPTAGKSFSCDVGKNLPESEKNICRDHAHFERPNPVVNPVGRGTQVRDFEEEPKDEAGEKSSLTLYTPPTKNDGDDGPYISLQSLFDLYHQNIHPLGPRVRSQIEAAVVRYTADWVKDAINTASDAGPSAWKWRYIEGILRKWASQSRERPRRSTGNEYEDDFNDRFGDQEPADPEPAEADLAAQQLWEQVLADLDGQVPLAGVRALSTDQHSITLEVPNRIVLAVLERRHYRAIQQSLERVTKARRDICFRLGQPARVT